MTIANPIYDTVFKYLMEDLDIAKGLLSTILNVEIIELSFRPQETISENPLDTKTIRVYRIDFAAIIKQADGQTKKVLIELQKTKRNTNAIRFRRYLGENYQKEDTIIDTQTFKSSDEHALNYELIDDDPLLQKMVNRLTRAIADEEMRRKMNVEDEIEREFAEYQDTIEQKDEEIKQNKQVIEQKEKENEDLKRQLEAYKKLIGK